MKMLTTAALTLAALAGAAFGGAPDDWFDLENCGMCKNLLEDPELFQAMQWENHVLSNGMMEITVVPEGYHERFGKLMARMEAAGARLMGGEQMELCNFCRSYGGLMEAGAVFDQVNADAGYVSVTTSADPEVVAMIHEHAKTTIVAYEAMAAEQGQGDGHGHDHDHPHQH